MLSVSFTCLKSRQNKSGQSPIQLWVNVDGKRATTIQSLRAAPQEFQKAMKSKQNNPILLYCNNIRERITELFANSSYSDKTIATRQIRGGVVRALARLVRHERHNSQQGARQNG